MAVGESWTSDAPRIRAIVTAIVRSENVPHLASDEAEASLVLQKIEVPARGVKQCGRTAALAENCYVKVGAPSSARWMAE